MAERRMPEVVAKADRLDEILVERQRPCDRPGDLRDLKRVREPRAVMVALGRNEHLGLVHQPAESLAVDDPVTVTLERRAQAAVGLGSQARRRVGGRRERRELRPLTLLYALCEAPATGPSGCARLAGAPACGCRASESLTARF